MDQVEQVDEVEALGGRIFEAALGAADILSIYLGDRLGWYRSLTTDGPCTAAELAGRTGTHERYAREWLEQQAVTGLLDRGGRRRPGRPPLLDPRGHGRGAHRRAEPHLPGAHGSDVRARPRSSCPRCWTPTATAAASAGSSSAPDARESQADMNRPWFERQLPGALAGVPTVHEALRRPGARIADVGCGGGWSSIALARAYPDATVDGFDVDAALGRHGPGERRRVPASATGCASTTPTPPGSPTATYDAVFAFECVHDMPRPVEVLAAVRARAARPTASSIVMDEAVAETFTAPGDDLERLMYGFSLLVCLPDGMSQPAQRRHRHGDAPGHAARLRAGGRVRPTFEVLPIEDFGFWRFYRLAR